MRVMGLDLTADVVALTAALVDVESVSGDEAGLADLVHEALVSLPHLKVERIGNNVLARTDLGRDRRVVVAGHLDTVPIADTIEAFNKIADGEYDHVAEQAFFMCGGLDDVERQWAEIQKNL